MTSSRRQAVRALAVVSVLFFCADPVITTVHLLGHSHHHAWCQVHNHVIHVDPDAPAVGSDEITSVSFWDEATLRDDAHDECAALIALRGEPAGMAQERVGQPKTRKPATGMPVVTCLDDVLAKAPKHGPPGTAPIQWSTAASGSRV